MCQSFVEIMKSCMSPGRKPQQGGGLGSGRVRIDSRATSEMRDPFLCYFVLLSDLGKVTSLDSIFPHFMWSPSMKTEEIEL